MTTLDVEQMTVALHLGDDGSGGDRLSDVDRALRRAADDGLARRLPAAGLPAYGEWCVRRLTATVTYDEESLGRLEADWADAVLAALGASLHVPASGPAAATAEVVHYRHRDAAVLDLVASLVRGRDERRWAWRQLGLLPRASTSDRDTVLAVLGRHPHLALAAVRDSASVSGVAALHRLLGEVGWTALARLATVAAGAPGAPSTAGGEDQVVQRAEGRPTPHPWHDPMAGPLLPDSPLLRSLARSGIRPTAPTARAWAVLALLDADPACLDRPGARQRLTWLAERLARAGATAATDRPDRDAQERQPVPLEPESVPVSGPDGVPTAQPEAPGPAAPVVAEPSLPGTTPADAGDPAEPMAAAAAGPATAWGGLPFLLGSAARAGLPGLLDDPRLAGRDTRWLVHRLAALVLGPATELVPDDPARLALCGLPPGAPAPSGPDPTSAELAALDAVGATWCEATHRLLAHSDTSAYAPLAPRAAVRRMAARRAEVRGEAGWIDVLLRLEEVDTDVRLAGLDLDPGWVPWLGTVVRFRYE